MGEQQTTVPAVPGARTGRQVHVLLLSDLAEDLGQVELALAPSSTSFRLTHVTTADGLPARLRLTSPDVVLAGCTLPHFLGLQAIEMVRQLEPNLPFVVLADAEAETAAIECVEKGADDYVCKTSLSRLPTALLGAIAKREAERDRARGVARLRSNERLQRLIAENTRDLVCLLDGGGRVVHASNSFRDSLGRSPAGLVDVDFATLLHEEDRSALKVGRQRALAGQEWKADLRCADSKGNWRCLEVIAKPVGGAGRGLARVVLVARDVTEQRRAEAEAREHLARLRGTVEGTIKAMAMALEMRDPYTAGHQRRVTALACAIAEELGLTDSAVDGVNLAGLTHDIGKISIPAEILSKPGPLSAIEMSLVRTHTQLGYSLLSTVDLPWPVAVVALQHHERIDGSGYPAGLKGDEITLEARILAVADALEAMASHRPYRPALGVQAAMSEIVRNSGKLYAEDVVGACVKVVTERGFTFPSADQPSLLG